MNAGSLSGDHVLVPVTITVKASTVRLLSEIAQDMGISLDDVISVLAEDAAIDLEIKCKHLIGTIIPDKCSKEDLIKAME